MMCLKVEQIRTSLENRAPASADGVRDCAPVIAANFPVKTAPYRPTFAGTFLRAPDRVDPALVGP